MMVTKIVTVTDINTISPGFYVRILSVLLAPAQGYKIPVKEANIGYC